MNGHTPGPWREGIEGNNRVYSPDGRGDDSGLIAVVYKGRGNIRLIAAAPDLLEALDRLLGAYIALARSGDCGSWSPENDDEVVSARAAIANAKGDTP